MDEKLTGIPWFSVADDDLPRGTPGLADCVPREKWSVDEKVQTNIAGIPGRRGEAFMDQAGLEWWQNRFDTTPSSDPGRRSRMPTSTVAVTMRPHRTACSHPTCSNGQVSHFPYVACSPLLSVFRNNW